MPLIEHDHFPFEVLSTLAERESWRKEIHRPIYHVHKWWAKRLGSVFRGILLGCLLDDNRDLTAEFHRTHNFVGWTVFDPFMGSGTTIGEAHKLGLTALGRDINPVAVEAVRTALGPIDRKRLRTTFEELSEGVGAEIRSLYHSVDAECNKCDVLYHFWVMQATCPGCLGTIDLFPSYVVARNAYPSRKPNVQVVCPACGDIAPGTHGADTADCHACGHRFDPGVGPARGAKAFCRACDKAFSIIESMAACGGRPNFRLYGKLVLASDGHKEYLPVTPRDLADYATCSARLAAEIAAGTILLPSLALAHGHNTRQAMNYGFRCWRDFFNDRQLLALGWLRRAIYGIADEPQGRALSTLFSGVLEFNNLFASYKGEGTGAVRHMFSHHILKPERAPIEANVWGTPKSSGSFSNLFRSRLLRAIEYRRNPTEIALDGASRRVCSPPFSEVVECGWPHSSKFAQRGIYLSCGTSSDTGLADGTIDLVVTDPPFFDNVHYSELADFFYAWQQLKPNCSVEPHTTRSAHEVQDTSSAQFASKLADVFRECHRVLRDDGLLVFTYHHSRDDGWQALAGAVIGAGFSVINSQPVKSEMSVATPKSQAKEPIAFDIILVCRKQPEAGTPDSTAKPQRGTVSRVTVADALDSAQAKIDRLLTAGFALSRNDRRIILYGQLLTTIATERDAAGFASIVDTELNRERAAPRVTRHRARQQVLFEQG
jgi:putative DNA methylase